MGISNNWYMPEGKVLTKEKRKAYLRYRINRTNEERENFVSVRKWVNPDI